MEKNAMGKRKIFSKYQVVEKCSSQYVSISYYCHLFNTQGTFTI